MSSYYARLTMGMGHETLVAVTGSTSDALKVIDVDIRGNPIGQNHYVPAGVLQSPMEIGPDGYLSEVDELANEEIDWESHEDRDSDGSEEDIGAEDQQADMSSVSPRNPALAAFPELQ